MKQLIPGSDELQIVGYYLRSLSIHEKNYPIRDKELLAVVYLLDKTAHLIFGHRIVVKTDHQSLSVLLKGNKEAENDRVKRWITKLAEFDIVLEYVKGTTNELADYLSRYVGALESVIPAVNLTEAEIKASIESDEYFAEISNSLRLIEDKDNKASDNASDVAETRIDEEDVNGDRLDVSQGILKNFKLIDGKLFGRTNQSPWRRVVGALRARRLIQ